MSEKVDLLNRGEFIENLKSIVKMLADKKQGCCFAIDGAWGSGKSFVLEKFENEIKLAASEETVDDKYLVFHYDCWKYDYYEEPAIAIVAAMQDTTDKELSVFSKTVENGAKLAWNTTKGVLTKVASELCKNKIGIDLVEIASEVLEDYDEDKDKEFDSLYGFKRALDKTRAGIKEIAEDKTVVVVVDELDRCLPEYAIKVLERLHHIFTDIENVIVIISMDKNQLTHSIKGIYGDIPVDKYLRKFISFRVNLDNGNASKYFDKYQSYTSMFDCTENEKIEIEEFFVEVMRDIDMRSQERIFANAEIIHNLVKEKELEESSFLTFEILVLTARLVLKQANVYDLIKRTKLSNESKKAVELHTLCRKYIENMRKTSYNTRPYYYVQRSWSNRMFFWIAVFYAEYRDNVCDEFFYRLENTDRIESVKKIMKVIEMVDND